MEKVYSLGTTYLIVFLGTLFPAGWFLRKAVRTVRQHGWRNAKAALWILIAAVVWFSPSLVTGLQAVMVKAPAKLFAVLAVLGIVGLFAFAKALIPKEPRRSLAEGMKELIFVLFVVLVERILKVQFLSSDDQKAMDLITKFRGEYVTWAGSSEGVPREIDEYDTQSTTLHIAVFLRTPLKDWLVGYGRLLFGCQQMQEKYTHVLDEDIQFERAVEVSRLLVVPTFYGYPIRGTKWSAIVQLLIYRRFFQACEERDVVEWWAVLGRGLHRLLNGFGFPFERVNDLQGEDAAGTYFAVRMQIEAGRQSLASKSPRLYRWFCTVENRPVRFTRMNGRQGVPLPTATIQKVSG